MKVITAILLSMLLFNNLCFALTDTEIKQKIIQKSINNYSGSCSCPYSFDKKGHRCGGRSAYSRPGGQAPLCYPSDVTPEMVEKYKKNMK